MFKTIHRGSQSPSENFTIFSNAHIQNSLLTWEARGLLHYLLSLPEDWRLYVDELSNRSPAGETINRRIMKELQSFGHVRRVARRGDDGRYVSAIWEVWSDPFGWERES